MKSRKKLRLRILSLMFATIFVMQTCLVGSMSTYAKEIVDEQTESVEQEEVKEAEPENQEEVKEAEPVEQEEAKEAEPVEHEEAKEAEPVEQEEVKEAEPENQEEVKEAEPENQEEVKEAEPEEQEEVKEAEPAEQEEAKEAKPEEQEEAKEAEPEKQEEAKEAEPEKQEEAKEAEPEKQEEAKEPEPAKVPVYTEKKDQDGNPLEGALLQIIDSVKKIWDEWISDGTAHKTDLPEGDYVLHEKEAPDGYEKGNDIPFKVVIKVNDANGNTTHDANPDVCPHYTGVPFYDINEDGTHLEVYCINQGWEEPHEVNYDGKILDVNNIKDLAPDADPEMSEVELYNKVLDIIYHRSKAKEQFPDFSDTEIRFLTEYALKNYTSAIVSDGRINFFREYTYAPEDKKGYIVTPGKGSTLGKLAQHWWTGHGRKHIPERYAEFYNYLISDDDHHPDDMHLFIYSSKMPTEEEELYQNLLGVSWFNPEDYQVNLTMVNVKKNELEEPEPKPEPESEPESELKPEPELEKSQKSEKPEEPTISPKTSDEANTVVFIVLAGFAIVALGGIFYIKKKKL